MSTVAPDRPAPAPTDAPSRRGYLVPLAAAAVVAAIAVSSLWWRGLGDEGTEVLRASHGVAAQEQLQEQGFRAVLDAPGWTASSTEAGDGYGEVSYTKGDQYASRSPGTRPPPSPTTSRIGSTSSTRPPPGSRSRCSAGPGSCGRTRADDHTVIREVEDGHWMELRGERHGRGGVRRTLLAELRLVGPWRSYEAHPAGRRTRTTRRAFLRRSSAIRDGHRGGDRRSRRRPGRRSGAANPASSQRGPLTSWEPACAGQLRPRRGSASSPPRQAGRRPGAGRTEAARVLGTSREWPVLQADERAAATTPRWSGTTPTRWRPAQLPDWYVDGLGCS